MSRTDQSGGDGGDQAEGQERGRSHAVNQTFELGGGCGGHDDTFQVLRSRERSAEFEQC
jgi:hypothetical protein